MHCIVTLVQLLTKVAEILAAQTTKCANGPQQNGYHFFCAFGHFLSEFGKHKFIFSTFPDLFEVATLCELRSSINASVCALHVMVESCARPWQACTRPFSSKRMTWHGTRKRQNRLSRSSQRYLLPLSHAHYCITVFSTLKTLNVCGVFASLPGTYTHTHSYTCACTLDGHTYMYVCRNTQCVHSHVQLRIYSACRQR